MSKEDNICNLLAKHFDKQLKHIYLRSEKSPTLQREYGATVCLKKAEAEIATDVKLRKARTSSAYVAWRVHGM